MFSGKAKQVVLQGTMMCYEVLYGILRYPDVRESTVRFDGVLWRAGRCGRFNRVIRAIRGY